MILRVFLPPTLLVLAIAGTWLHIDAAGNLLSFLAWFFGLLSATAAAGISADPDVIPVDAVPTRASRWWNAACTGAACGIAAAWAWWATAGALALMLSAEEIIYCIDKKRRAIRAIEDQCRREGEPPPFVPTRSFDDQPTSHD